jgi:hypothetical protein
MLFKWSNYNLIYTGYQHMFEPLLTVIKAPIFVFASLPAQLAFKAMKSRQNSYKKRRTGTIKPV